MFKFKRMGERGTWINPEVLPHTAKIADEIAIIRSMNTEAIHHDPAITYINTGRQQPGRPRFGSWISYGLGSVNQNLPAYVVFVSVGAMPGQALFSRLWGSGSCPPGTRACNSVEVVTRYSTFRIRPGLTRARDERCWLVLPV